MPLYQAIILAIVQGLTEFLPVSSTAHLALIPEIFHWQDPGLGFDIALHVGTLAAIFIYFFRDWVTVIANGLGFQLSGIPSRMKTAVQCFGIWLSLPFQWRIAGLLFKQSGGRPLAQSHTSSARC